MTVLLLSLTAQLEAVGSKEGLKEAIPTALLKKLLPSLMMDVSELDVSRSLTAYGTDSLVTVEMKNWIQRETKATISVFEISQASSIWCLVEGIAERASNGKTD